LLLGPLAITYGWKTAFIATGVLGAAWLLIWAAIARPPFLPKSAHMTSKMAWPNLRERRVWALMFSYALPAISPGPVLTILAIYLVQRLHLTQADVNNVVWIPPLTWGIGYFFWGWAADTFAANNPRPIGMFALLTVVSLTLGLTTMTTSVPLAIALISLSTFIGGGFQMVALKVGSYAFPREQSALMSGIASGSWSLVNFILLNAIGAGVTIAGVKILPGANLISGGRWAEIFWVIALLPAVGIAVWLALSRNQTTVAKA